MHVGVLIVEESPIVRLGLRRLFESAADMSVVADVGDGESAVRAAGEFRADFVIIAEGLRGCNGSTLAPQLRAIHPGIVIAVMTFGMRGVDAWGDSASRFLTAGISGIIHYHDSVEEIVAAMKAMMDGKVVISSRIREPQPGSLARNAEEAPPQMGLTPREVDVLGLLVTGMTNKQVAASISLSVRTVESHRARMMAKLGLRSAAQLAHFALSHGIAPAHIALRTNEDHPPASINRPGARTQ
jgi:DNA-binding NarL/FixJ family response regulator